MSVSETLTPVIFSLKILDTIDLRDKYFNDNLDNPLKWKFPENTKIEPDGYLIIWADEDGKAGFELHPNF